MKNNKLRNFDPKQLLNFAQTSSYDIATFCWKIFPFPSSKSADFFPPFIYISVRLFELQNKLLFQNKLQSL